MNREWDERGAAGNDAAIIATAHDVLTSVVPLIIDTRGACQPATNVVKA